MASKKRAPKKKSPVKKQKRSPAKRPPIPKKRKPPIRERSKRPKAPKKQTPKKRRAPKKRRTPPKKREEILRDIRKNIQELNSEEFRDVFKDMIRRRQDDLFANFVELPVRGLDGLLIDEEIEVLQRLRDSYSETGSIHDEASRVAAEWGVEIREVYTFWIYNGVAA